jgi:hypothetical protein
VELINKNYYICSLFNSKKHEITIIIRQQRQQFWNLHSVSSRKLIKQQYPDIEEVTNDIPDWHKNILISRLEAISQTPERIKPIEGLYKVLNRKVN